MSSAVSSLPRRRSVAAAKSATVAPRRPKAAKVVVAPVPTVTPTAVVSVTKAQSNTKSSKASFQLTLGSDPELMLVDKHDNNKIVSSLRVIKRDKHDPIILPDKVTMFADNTLVESSFAPVLGFETIVPRFKTVFTRLYEALDTFGKGRYSLLPQASHVYDQAELLADERSLEIGCTPSLDVYAACVHTPAPFQDGLRTGSMHIHLGLADYEKQPEGKLMTLDSKELTVKVLDVILGCASIVIDKDPTAPERRRLYGQAGNWRQTPWGLEYRTMGNYCLRTPELTQLAWDLVAHAMSHIEYDTAHDLLKAVNSNTVQEAINTSNTKLARQVLAKATLPHKLLARVEQDYTVPSFEAAWGV